jgi:hypothetical protein
MLAAYIVVVVADWTYDDQYPCKLPVEARFGEHAKQYKQTLVDKKNHMRREM